MGLKLIVEELGETMLGLLSGSAVIAMLALLLGYVSGF